MARSLARDEGIMAGMSSGPVMLVAAQRALLIEEVVVILIFRTAEKDTCVRNYVLLMMWHLIEIYIIYLNAGDICSNYSIPGKFSCIHADQLYMMHLTWAIVIGLLPQI
jgi:hypothetical protein